MIRRVGRLLTRLTRTGTLVRVATERPRIALTFDDGPSPVYTPQLLDILARHGARATFFMVGETAARYPELVAEVAERGHAVGNHSWNHPSFPLLSGAERRWQMRRCAQALKPHDQKLFRPPFGHQSIASRLDALWLGYEVVAWTRVGGDWQNRTADQLLQQLTARLAPGDILLMHDSLYSAEQSADLDRTPTLEAVERLLAENPDYEFVTVPELIRSGRPVRRPYYRRGDQQWLDSLNTGDTLQGATEVDRST